MSFIWSFFMPALLAAMSLAAQDGMYMSKFPEDLEATKNRICWRDGLSPAYTAGKTIEIFLGPAAFTGAYERVPNVTESFAEVQLATTHLLFMHCPAPSAIRWCLHHCLLSRNYDTLNPALCSLRLQSQIWPTSVASCQRIVGHIFREMADDPAMIRYAEIKGCASASLLLENGRREQIMAWTFLMSKLSHNLGYTPLFTCVALQSSEITSWLNMIATETFWITSFADDTTCSDADHGCLQEGSQRAHTENCKPEDWRLCESAMIEERAFVTSGFYQAAREVSVQGFLLVKGILDLRAEQLVEEVYLSVLKRRADESGLTAYTTMIASGGTAAQVAESLKRSEEYINLSGKMDQGAVAKATETVFKDMLLRAGEDSELGGFIDLFNDYVANGIGMEGAKAEMQRILRGSKEYRDVCEGQVMTCDQGKTLVKSSYQDILERDPDHGGLVNYARELVTGQMTEEVLRRTLQESSEYRDILSFRHSIIETVEIVKKRWGHDTVTALIFPLLFL